MTTHGQRRRREEPVTSDPHSRARGPRATGPEFGSAAVDLAWVAEGRIDANIMLGNKPWDTAAGVLIAREAGAVVVDMGGSPHAMNARATIAANLKILADLVELIAEADRDANRSE